MLHTIQAVQPGVVHSVSDLQAISVAGVHTCLHDLWQAAVWRDYLPSNTCQHRAFQNSKGFKLATYRHWFCTGKPSDGEPNHCPVSSRHGFIYHIQRPNQVRALACSRLSAHDLNIEQQRHAHISRLQHVCLCCHANAVEDELHILECPAYQDIRQSFTDVLGDLQHPLCDADMYHI